MRSFGISLLLAALLGACAARPRLPTTPGDVQRGKATWYGGKLHGGPTASGERFDENAMTCAHRTLPMNTMIEVENLRNGRRVTLRVNDRGPYGPGRIVDVSHEAARRLDMVEAGVVPVVLRVLSLPPPKAKKKRRSS